MTDPQSANSKRFKFSLDGWWWKLPLALAGGWMFVSNLTSTMKENASERLPTSQVESSKPLSTEFSCTGTHVEDAVKEAISNGVMAQLVGLKIMGFRNNQTTFQTNDALGCQAEILTSNDVQNIRYKFSWFDKEKTQSYVEVRQDFFREEVIHTLAQGWDEQWALFRSIVHPSFSIKLDQGTEDTMLSLYGKQPMVEKYWQSYPQEQEVFAQELKQMIKEKMQQERAKLQKEDSTESGPNESNLNPPSNACSSGYESLFSCVTPNGKQISLCQAGEIVRYFFGKTESEPEIALTGFKEDIVTSDSTMSMTFSNGKTTYKALWPKVGEPTPASGVEVNMGNGQSIWVGCAG
ncbi:MAG: hypothetical protein WAZ18_03035 [Alphaproteobacteria bacterium]